MTVAVTRARAQASSLSAQLRALGARAIEAPTIRIVATSEALPPLSEFDLVCLTSANGVELLFERLAVRWVISGGPTEKPRELLTRFRVASAEERAWVRGAIREHCAENFPDVQAP